MLLTADMKCMLASLSFQSFWELDANWTSTSSNTEGEFKMKIIQINFTKKKKSLYFSALQRQLA